MIILGIETSCDETAAAVLKKSGDRIQILSNIVASSAALQAKYGGIIPEQAAREQIKSIIPVITEALQEAQVTSNKLDAIAVTFGPGLIGSLLVGVETAKTLATVWQKHLIPVNHLLGHFYANWISEGDSFTVSSLVRKNSQDERITNNESPKFPCIGLLVSGGHTDLVLFTGHNKYKYLGGTRDDAAGECFDKCARLLGLPYPGGPQISKLAKEGAPKAFDLPRPMINSKDFDFSFSGLKTSVANLITERSNVRTNDLAAAIEQAIIDVLVSKTIKAAKLHKVKNIMVAGGVAANQKLKEGLGSRVKGIGSDITLHIPPANLCTDNAAMIAAAAFFEKPLKDPLFLQADPGLSLTY